MENKYEPELGQFMFGQDWQDYEASYLLISALEHIDYELERIMRNITQEEYPSPFANTANRFECDVFEVEAYSWNDKYEQPYNFKWKDVEISWYKYLGRGTSVNQKMSNDKINDMLNECMDALYKYEKENCDY